MAQPFSVFLMVQFMKGLPRELEEWAMLDGATRLTIFRRIILPLVKPALTAVAILSFQGAWNDFQWPLLTLDSQNMYTLPVGLFCISLNPKASPIAPSLARKAQGGVFDLFGSQYWSVKWLQAGIESILRGTGRDCILVEFICRSAPSRPYKSFFSSLDRYDSII